MLLKAANEIFSKLRSGIFSMALLSIKRFADLFNYSIHRFI